MKYVVIMHLALITLSMLLLPSSACPQTDPTALVEAAERFEKIGNYNSAVEIYLSLSAGYRDQARLQNNLGADYFALGKDMEAVASLKRSIELDPTFERAYYNLGTAYVRLGLSTEAISVLQKAVDLDPKHLEARTKLCDVSLGSERYDQAVACYNILLAIEPADAQSYSNLGVALMHLDRSRKAIEAFEAAVRLDAGLEKLNNLGVALLNIRNYRKAIDVFQQALQIEPEDATVRYNLAIAQLGNGNQANALAQYSFLKTRNGDLARQLFNVIFKSRVILVENK